MSKLKKKKQKQKKKEIKSCTDSIERKIFKCTEIPLSLIEITSLITSSKNTIHYIKIRSFSNTNKKMILLHGYGSNKSSFYKLVSYLYKKYTLYLFDLPAMNFNTKPDKIPFDNITTCLAYFINEIDQFVTGINLKKFDLLGHSLGGYLAAHYFDKFPEKVNQLFLLSPGGFHDSYSDQKNRTIAILQKFHFFRRIMMKYIACKIWEEKKSIFEIFSKFFTKMLFRFYFKMERMKMNKEEAKLFSELTNKIIDTNQIGEKCLGYLFDFGIKSKKPIEKILEKENIRRIKIRIIYGDNDWMDYKKTIITVKEKQFNVEIYLVKNAGHQLIFENPKEIADLILNFL